MKRENKAACVQAECVESTEESRGGSAGNACGTAMCDRG